MSVVEYDAEGRRLAETHATIEPNVRDYNRLVAWLEDNDGVLRDEALIARIREVTGWDEPEATAMLRAERGEAIGDVDP